MKKLLLLGLAIITALTSTGVQAFAGELHTNEEVGKCTVIDAEGKFLEELFVPVGPYEFSLNSKLQPRGATDLYYYYIDGSLQWTGSERKPNGQENTLSVVNKGNSYATLARYFLQSVPHPAANVLGYTTYLVNVASGIATMTGTVNKLTQFFKMQGSISFIVKDALGNYVDTVVYTNVYLAHSKKMMYFDSDGNEVVEDTAN